MDEDVVRTCVSCAHIKLDDAQVYYPHGAQRPATGPECLHPKAHSRDMIYGKAYCQAERNDSKGCGKKGKLWVSAETGKKS